ncbi:hypothetical protein GCM10010503_35990 [Streptomyces lucensis JCM 4490]|uniref:Uncharacterized protein n=1 Tax=Streptomyces lucensis JCM 4490 TaxID=1306176 RepID=A0A918J7L1_9ACTN|nr:hypothetical protein [Streptomyces lucensis]GGW55699.1 hypothetical protein GCM10010503_35990 [Streptomyces lucensis JCM 4490]
MDLDAVVDELYSVAPGDFTAARDERARAASAEGDRELSEQIRRLRRPTLAAWASNLLVREQPDEVKRLVQLGEALRRAHQDLDGEQLRELSARQHQVTSALARQAGRLTAQAGQRISDDMRQEVQDTLHAVLADPEAAEQWAKGRLTKPLSAPAGFPALFRQPTPPSADRRTEPAGEVADLEAARTRRREQEERLERARQQAADAEQDLHDREAELTTAEEQLGRAEDEQRQAEQRVTELSRQLQDAEHEQQRVREAARKARAHTRDADRAAREARRRAEEAAAHARELAEQTRHRA